MIRNIFVASVVAVAWVSVGWAAEGEVAPHKHERVGLASGAAIGGLAGGPLGFVFGAALGGWLGDEFDSQRGQRIAYERSWQEAQAIADELNVAIQGRDRELTRMQSDYRRETAEMRERLREALDVQVLFKTGASDLADDVSQRIGRIAELGAELDGTLFRIEGHADARGAPDFNEQLSAERAAAVRDILIRAGVPSSWIVIDARGESEARAADADVDGMALDRRVQLTLIPADTRDRVAQK